MLPFATLAVLITMPQWHRQTCWRRRSERRTLCKHTISIARTAACAPFILSRASSSRGTRYIGRPCIEGCTLANKRRSYYRSSTRYYQCSLAVLVLNQIAGQRTATQSPPCPPPASIRLATAWLRTASYRRCPSRNIVWCSGRTLGRFDAFPPSRSATLGLRACTEGKRAGRDTAAGERRTTPPQRQSRPTPRPAGVIVCARPTARRRDRAGVA